MVTDKYNFLSYDELFDAIENDLSDNKFKALAQLLMSAVTDWHALNLREPKNLIIELKKEINNKLTFDSIEGYLKKLKPSHHAWKMEAISALLEMFDFERKNLFDMNIELPEIIERVTQHYRQK